MQNTLDEDKLLKHVQCVVFWTERCSIVYVHVSHYDVIHSHMRTSSFPVYKLFCTMQKISSANKSVRDKVSLLLVPLLSITSGDEDLRIYSDGEAGPRRLV